MSKPAKAFSVLAHEAVVDAVWDTGIKPLLNQKFPNISAAGYKTAHAYAYGGCLMADMGYMPGGDEMFTDLLHYIRSGDFVMNLLDQAQTLNDYAFALGALSHYMADKYGHSLATNKTVPIIFPKLRKKFGNTVTYDDDHTSHSRVEFAYDVVQISVGNYANSSYHDFIGFEMDVPLLQKAFKLTYGQDISLYFPNINSNINEYRWGVRRLFPRMLRNASRGHKDEIARDTQTAVTRTFHYRMSRHMFNIEYGKDRGKNHNFFARALATIIEILPKVGPLKKLKFVDPTPAGEKLFAQSFKTIVQQYSDTLTQLGQKRVNLPDIDFDTGNKTAAGEYHLTDKTYAELVMSLSENHFAYLTPDLKRNIIDYYSTTKPQSFDWLKPKNKEKLFAALKDIKKAQPVDANTVNSTGGR